MLFLNVVALVSAAELNFKRGESAHRFSLRACPKMALRQIAKTRRLDPLWAPAPPDPLARFSSPWFFQNAESVSFPKSAG